MKRFEDERTKQIYDTRFAPGVPQHVSIAAHALMHPLVASCSLQDVAVLGSIIVWPRRRNEYGLHVDGKWHLIFAWSDEMGAHALSLKRR